jgi:hypothetical protein
MPIPLSLSLSLQCFPFPSFHTKHSWVFCSKYRVIKKPLCTWWLHCRKLQVMFGARGGAVVEALRYKPEGRGIDSRCYWIFHWHNPSGRTMALGSTQPLTEMSTRNISWG